MNTLKLQTKPLNVSAGLKIIGSGTFLQSYDTVSGMFFPSYSPVMPLKVTVSVFIQDPDGIMTNGEPSISRIDWYLREYKTANKLSENNPDYLMAVESGKPVLRIQKNTPTDGALYLIGEAFYLNHKTGRLESVIVKELLSSVVYSDLNLSLSAVTPQETVVDPTKLEAQPSGGWNVTLQTKLKNGDKGVTEGAYYFWYVKEKGVERPLTTSYTWLVTQPSADGRFGDTVVVDSSRFKNVKLVCRAALRQAGDEIPAYASDPSLFRDFNVRVDMPPFNGAVAIPIAGTYIEPKDLLTTSPDKLVKMKCQITAGNSIIIDPEKYYNITWMAKKSDGSEIIIGYGENISKGVRVLGINYTTMVTLYPIVKEKLGNWNVEGSIYNGLPATPVLQYGSNQIADKLGAYLVSCPDGINPVIIGKLKNNNWMRFEDGSLAPTTVNSAAEDKGYNIMYGWVQTIHTIENALVGDEIVSLFGESPFEYNGAKSVPIPPTLICPGLPALVDGKFRSMYFKYRAGEGGSNGELGIKTFNNPQRTYPKTGLSQLTTNDYAVAHNADITKTIPYAPLMDWHLLNITNALMNKFGTVYLHDTDKFGGGISSNTTPNGQNINYTTGIQWRINSSDALVVQKLSEQPSFCVDASGTKKTWNEIISSHCPRMECMEIQMVLSYAAEQNIRPDTPFSYDGGYYRYFDIPNTKTLLEGEMNAKLMKTVQLNTTRAFDTSGNPITINLINMYLQTSAVYGMDLVSADVFQYAGAGIEHIVEIKDAATGNNPQNNIRHYRLNDQKYLSLDKTYKFTSYDAFGPEGKFYRYEWVSNNSQTTGFYINLRKGMRTGQTRGGSLSNNSAYSDLSNYTNGAVGDIIRLGHRVRGYGLLPNCSARSLTAISLYAHAYEAFAGGFQVRLPEGA